MLVKLVTPKLSDAVGSVQETTALANPGSLLVLMLAGQDEIEGGITSTGVTTTESWSSSPGSWLPGMEVTSGRSDAVTSAVFVMLATPTVPVMVRVAALPSSRLGTLHWLLINVPMLGMTPGEVSCAGTESVTTMPVTSSGPELLSVMVNVTTSPGYGVGSSTRLVSDRFAFPASLGNSFRKTIPPVVELAAPAHM